MTAELVADDGVLLDAYSQAVISVVERAGPAGGSLVAGARLAGRGPERVGQARASSSRPTATR